MNDLQQTAQDLLRMTDAKLVQFGKDCLGIHIKEQATNARIVHGGLSPCNIETFLADRNVLRHPTRLVLGYGEMEPHQFAEPGPDTRDDTGKGRILYLRPVLGQRSDLIALAISYMVPVINYGDAVTDEDCLGYGAALMGMDRETYYGLICELADVVGAEECLLGESCPSQPAELDCGCPNRLKSLCA